MLRERCEECDRYARYGGDEFVLCLPAALDQARATVAAVVAAVAGQRWSEVSPGLRVTIGWGIAEPRPAGTPRPPCSRPPTGSCWRPSGAAGTWHPSRPSWTYSPDSQQEGGRVCSRHAATSGRNGSPPPGRSPGRAGSRTCAPPWPSCAADPDLTPDEDLELGIALAVCLTNAEDLPGARLELERVRPLLPRVSALSAASFHTCVGISADGDGDEAVASIVLALASVESVSEASRELALVLRNCGMRLAMEQLFPLAVETTQRAVAVAAAAGLSPGGWQQAVGYAMLCWAMRLEHLGQDEEARARWLDAEEQLALALADPEIGRAARARWCGPTGPWCWPGSATPAAPAGRWRTPGTSRPGRSPRCCAGAGCTPSASC